MSGVHRFLSKRDKNRNSDKTHSIFHSSNKTNPLDKNSTIDPKSAVDFYGLFHDNGKATNTEEEKVKLVRQKIVHSKSVLLRESQALWALRSTIGNGNSENAYDLLLALSNASEGIVAAYDPGTRLLGAVNRQGVTCFLDSTLFAMFSRLDSFEAMLYNTFEDVARNKLAFLLRLWVNLLRMGRLITVDITVHIQDALAECGWSDAAKMHQQDASEAFTFITEKLQLPLLTLKMDMFHGGKHDADDHKFINERLLEVAIPAKENGDHIDIKLEDCLEEYFNNRIEVKRFLERRGTSMSTRSLDSTSKSKSVHVETVEVDPDEATPLTPSSPFSTSYMSQEAQPLTRHRTPSIIQERFIPSREEIQESATSPTKGGNSGIGYFSDQGRNSCLSGLIPWYTNHAPSSDAQVADHFSSKRPMLGLCLKRYSMQPNGKAIRLNTFVDVPAEIGLPHFIQDDSMDDEGPIYGNFKLSLQSVVCHRGSSVDSGHYISLVRGTSLSGNREGIAHWMRFDDLATERVTLIDIHKALREETPYLLFYQILPVDGDPGNVTDGEAPPSYTASLVDSGIDLQAGFSDRGHSIADSSPPSGRPSLELPTPEERGRRQPDLRRPSAVSFTDQFPVTGGPMGGIDDSIEARERTSTSLTRSYKQGMNVLTRNKSGFSSSTSKDTNDQLLVQDSVAAIPMSKSVVDEFRGVPKFVGKPESLKPDGAQRSRSPRREKSRNRLSRGIGKTRGDNPDRECVLM